MHTAARQHSDRTIAPRGAIARSDRGDHAVRDLHTGALPKVAILGGDKGAVHEEPRGAMRRIQIVAALQLLLNDLVACVHLVLESGEELQRSDYMPGSEHPALDERSLPLEKMFGFWQRAVLDTYPRTLPRISGGIAAIMENQHVCERKMRPARRGRSGASARPRGARTASRRQGRPRVARQAGRALGW